MTTLLIRPNRNEADRDALVARGLDVVVDPFLTISRHDNPEGALALLEALRSAEPVWLVVTSLNAWDNWLAQLPAGAVEEAVATNPMIRCGAIGETTAQVLIDLGRSEVVTPGQNDGLSLAEVIAEGPPSTVVLPSGSISMRSIPDTLQPKGFSVLEEVFYVTDTVEEAPPAVADVLSGAISSVVFRSPSAVRAFFHFVPEPPASLALVCGGRTTAREVGRLGSEPTVISASPTPESVADAVWMVEKGEGR